AGQKSLPVPESNGTSPARCADSKKPSPYRWLHIWAADPTAGRKGLKSSQDPEKKRSPYPAPWPSPPGADPRIVPALPIWWFYRSPPDPDPDGHRCPPWSPKWQCCWEQNSSPLPWPQPLPPPLFPADR